MECNYSQPTLNDKLGCICEGQVLWVWIIHNDFYQNIDKVFLKHRNNVVVVIDDALAGI